MTKTPSRPQESMHLDGGRYGKVEFHWTGDRYRHQWTFPGTGSDPLLQSVESGADAVWPLSPPLQQVICNRLMMAAKLSLVSACQDAVTGRPALQWFPNCTAGSSSSHAEVHSSQNDSAVSINSTQTGRLLPTVGNPPTVPTNFSWKPYSPANSKISIWEPLQITLCDP